MFLILGNSTLLYAKSPKYAEPKVIELTNKGITVRITKTPYRKDLPNGFGKGSWWGTDDSFPEYVITNIEVRINGSKIFMPLSTYGDLSDPTECYLKSIPKGVVIVINGGDTAGAYEADIIIKDYFVQEKKVKLLEFPDETWQDIKYSFPKGGR